MTTRFCSKPMTTQSSINLSAISNFHDVAGLSSRNYGEHPGVGHTGNRLFYEAHSIHQSTSTLRLRYPGLATARPLNYGSVDSFRSWHMQLPVQSRRNPFAQFGRWTVCVLSVRPDLPSVNRSLKTCCLGCQQG